MKLLLIPFVLFLINAESCSKNEAFKGLPKCIQTEIKTAMESDIQNPPMQIHQFDYNGEQVYLINSPCCDQFDYVYNTSCEKVCAPYGGITGKGDNQCSDFQQKALNKTLVWKDERDLQD